VIKIRHSCIICARMMACQYFKLPTGEMARPLCAVCFPLLISLVEKKDPNIMAKFIMLKIRDLATEGKRESSKKGINTCREKGIRLGRPSRYSRAEIDSVIAMSKQGISIRKIASGLNIPVGSVNRLLQRWK